MDLKEIREHLDRLDESILLLIAERLSFIPLVAKYKKENNLPRFQPEREKELLAAKRVLAEKYKVNPDLVEDIFKRIIEESHKIQKEILGE